MVSQERSTGYETEAETGTQRDGNAILPDTTLVSQETRTKVENDRLSALPRDIINLIQSYLPLDYAVRTSILSKQWQHMWKTIPDIVFDTEWFVFKEKGEEARSNELKLVESVNKMFKSHSGMIHKFEINHPNFTRSHTDTDQWIQLLSNCPLREFTLGIWNRESNIYKVHPSLFEFKGLTSLELWCCSLHHFPPTFGGFKHLKNLKLYSTPMSQARFEHLVKSCPLLEVVEYCDEECYFPTLKIDAPRLHTFSFEGFFDNLIFSHNENLAKVCFTMDWSKSNKSKEMPPACTSNLIELFRSLVNVQTLRIRTQFLKYLIHGYVPERLSTPFSNITLLRVDTDPMCKREIEAILCMLKSFPRLKNLILRFRGRQDNDEKSAKYFLEDEHRHLELPEVCLVEVLEFSDRFSELNLLEFILLASPKLKRLSVVDCISTRGRCPVEETTRRLRLASRQAKATILRRESCKGEYPDIVYWWLNDLDVGYISPHITESPPVPQEI